jgi:hypothetical protein
VPNNECELIEGQFWVIYFVLMIVSKLGTVTHFQKLQKINKYWKISSSMSLPEILSFPKSSLFQTGKNIKFN